MNEYKPSEWVVVAFPGMENECEVAKFDVIRDAYHYCDNNSDENYPLDVYRRLPSGELTTEY